MKRVTRQGNTPDSTITTIIVEEPVLTMANPNDEIFNVGVEEGGDDEDNMLSMIGDATQKHVDNLTVKDRLIWEHFIYTSNGTIFRRTPDLRFNDKDELNLHVEDLENFFETHNIPKAMHGYYQEAIEMEQERRDAVQIGSMDDIYNTNEGVVSFQEWEENPGMMKHVDIPSTPRDLMIPSGDTKQPYYDYFPEGHKDSKVLNQFIQLVNRDLDEFTPKFTKYMHQFVDSQPMMDHTRKVLHKVCNHLETASNYDDLIIQMLQAIDRRWGQNYRAKAMERTLEDPIIKLMLHNDKSFEKIQAAGINPSQQVKDFGKLLYTKFRKTIKPTHWHLYKRLKAKYKLQVIIQGVDVNTASIQQLRKILPDNKARDVWFARPFQTTVELHTKGLIERRMLTNSEAADKVLDVIVRMSEKKDIQKFNELRNALMAKQTSGTLTLDDYSWKNIWTYYRTLKTALLKEVNQDGKGREEIRA